MTRTVLSCVFLVLTGLSLAACGMNRAVGVLPNTLDDLAATSRGVGADARFRQSEGPTGRKAASSPDGLSGGREPPVPRASRAAAIVRIGQGDYQGA